jgi:serpin B
VNYDCGVELVDYQNDWETARVLINNWIANRTRERIQELFLPGILDSFTRLVLVDTLYLYASWRTAFDPNSNQTRTFHGITGDGSTDFMTTTLYLDYAAGEGWVGVDLPYYGDSLVLTAVLPDAGQFETVKASLGVTWLSSFDATSQPSLVGLTIPKFRLRSPTVAWDQALKDLGMTTLFDALSCNLEGISASKPLYVKTVVQQVYIELAEKGTEAAAATGVVINRDGGVPPPPQYYVVLDRPFLFFIRERGGPVLFAGQIVSLPVAN